MTFAESVCTCFQKYAVFSGRASRSEFWWFILCGALLTEIPVISFPARLVLFIPTLAVCSRRLHDRGKTGWLQAVPPALYFFSVQAFALLGLPMEEMARTVFASAAYILFAAALFWLIVELALEGTPGTNRYGKAASPISVPGPPACPDP